MLLLWLFQEISSLEHTMLTHKSSYTKIVQFSLHTHKHKYTGNKNVLEGDIFNSETKHEHFLKCSLSREQSLSCLLAIAIYGLPVRR